MIAPALGRLAYRVAYIGLVVFSHVVRPRTRGVKCLLSVGDDVLLVRHSYGPGKWDLPGGFCKRGEPFEQAARREVAEELGVSGGRFVDLGELIRDFHGRHETLHGFRVELDRKAVAARSFEIREAAWFPRSLLPEPRSPVVDDIWRLELGLPPLPRG